MGKRELRKEKDEEREKKKRKREKKREQKKKREKKEEDRRKMKGRTCFCMASIYFDIILLIFLIQERHKAY